MTLKELPVGKSAVITSVGGEGALRQHFLDMGVIPGTEVACVRLAPLGDPMELKIHGYELTLRLADAEKIEIAFGEDDALWVSTCCGIEFLCEFCLLTEEDAQ